METLDGAFFSPAFAVFNRIYEEWKHDFQITPANNEIEFNRIYEEWKLLWSFTLSQPDRCSIESMRNGNADNHNCFPRSQPVQSNLWGMETSKKPFGTLRKNRVQSNLWGMETYLQAQRLDLITSFNRIYEEWKPRHPHSTKSRKRSFNRIYEEWKLPYLDGYFTLYREFNRIYEEWKPSVIVLDGSVLLKFNRIYEEWKRESRDYPGRPSILFNRIYEEWKQISSHIAGPKNCRSIESMRNGNLGSREVPTEVFTVQSNLWGMETHMREFVASASRAVQSNLWGMETRTRV